MAAEGSGKGRLEEDQEMEEPLLERKRPLKAMAGAWGQVSPLDKGLLGIHHKMVWGVGNLPTSTSKGLQVRSLELFFQVED